MSVATSAAGPAHGGFGVVGLGIKGKPNTHRKRGDLCADYDHPGVTFNPWLNQTWCLCGTVVRDGDDITAGDWLHKADCCGGPLLTPIEQSEPSEGMN